jgi:hypothetical protein
MHESYPCLFSYAQNEDISVANYCSVQNPSELFQLPLSLEAYNGFQLIQYMINKEMLITDDFDVWKYKWGDKFTSAQFYNNCFRNINPPSPFLWIWKSKLGQRLKYYPG